MNRHVAALDRALDRGGEVVTLRRVVGAATQVFIDVKVRAFLRGYDPSELGGEITQQDQRFILSPTEIDRAQWPGGLPIASPPSTVDPRIPRKNDVLLTSRGKLTVQSAAGLYPEGELVRIEGRARGQ